jgi:hypothetical protein
LPKWNQNLFGATTSPDAGCVCELAARSFGELLSSTERSMTWGKVDDRLHAHPKPEQAGLEAMGLWALALSYSSAQLTDGVITRARVMKLADPKAADRAATRLVLVGMWHPANAPCPAGHEHCNRFRADVDGFRFHDWIDYQPTKEAVEAERERKRKNLAEHRKRNRNETESETGFTTDTKPVSSGQSPANGPIPIPTQKEITEPLVPWMPAEAPAPRPASAPSNDSVEVQRIRAALASHPETASFAEGNHAARLEGPRMLSGTSVEQVISAIADAAAETLDGELTNVTWRRVRVFCGAAKERAKRRATKNGPAPAYTNNRVQHDPPGKPQGWETAKPIDPPKDPTLTPEVIEARLANDSLFGDEP